MRKRCISLTDFLKNSDFHYDKVVMINADLLLTDI